MCRAEIKSTTSVWQRCETNNDNDAELNYTALGSSCCRRRSPYRLLIIVVVAYLSACQIHQPVGLYALAGWHRSNPLPLLMRPLFARPLGTHTKRWWMRRRRRRRQRQPQRLSKSNCKSRQLIVSTTDITKSSSSSIPISTALSAPDSALIVSPVARIALRRVGGCGGGGGGAVATQH